MSHTTDHRPATKPTEGAIANCATCDALFLGANRDGTIIWIPLRWWHKGWLRAHWGRTT